MKILKTKIIISILVLVLAVGSAAVYAEEMPQNSMQQEETAEPESLNVAADADLQSAGDAGVSEDPDGTGQTQNEELTEEPQEKGFIPELQEEDLTAEESIAEETEAVDDEIPLVFLQDDSTKKSSESSKKKITLAKPKIKDIQSRDGGLQISWNAVKNAETYRIYRRSKAGAKWKLLAKTTGLQYTDKTAKEGTKYQYTVAAQAQGRLGEKAKKMTGLFLSAPKLKSAKGSAMGTKIRWKTKKYATGYRIYRRKTAGGGWKCIGTSVTTSFFDQNYKAGTKYTYTVKAVNSKCKKCYSQANLRGVTAKARKLKVKFRRHGRTYQYLDGYFGISREELLAQLGKHEHDKYYRGTPQSVNDSRNSYGDPYHTFGSGDVYGVPGFNCTGFVWRALYDSGANYHMIPLMRGCGNCWQNPRNPGNNTWAAFARGDDGTIPVHYRFATVEALLKSGKAEKGDIIYCSQTGEPNPYGVVDSHVGIFYGDTPSDNKYFHSGPTAMFGGNIHNCISEINAGSPSVFVLFKFMPGKKYYK